MIRYGINGNTQNKENNISKLLDAAISLFLKKGLSAVSLGLVAEQCGLSVRTAINHFGSKDKLITAALDKYFDESYVEIDKLFSTKEYNDLTGLEQAKFYMDFRKKNLFEHPNVYFLVMETELYFAQNNVPYPLIKRHYERLDYLGARMSAAIRKGIADGTIRSDIDIKKAENLLITSYMAQLLRFSTLLLRNDSDMRGEIDQEMSVFFDTVIYYLTQYPMIVRNIRSRKMLVIDDLDVNRDIIGSLFKKDFDVILAENGAEGMEKLEANPDIAIIILDLYMPIMDGFDFLKRVRGDARFNDTAIVVNTAYGEDENEVHALRLGADEFIFKPFNRDIIKYRIRNTLLKFDKIIENRKLQSRLANMQLLCDGGKGIKTNDGAEWLKAQSRELPLFDKSNGDYWMGADTPDRTKPLLMIVEDDAINRKILKKILETRYDTVEAENGRQALEYLTEHDGDVSLILLDLIMPVMNGFEFLEEFKKSANYDNIPIIITSQAGEKSEEKALAMGADEFIAKPYIAAVIIQRVSKALENAQIRAVKVRLEGTKKIVKDALCDYLTGIYNRRGLDMLMNSDGFFREGAMSALYMFDIDNLKACNDTNGHSCGDQIITLFARKLTESLRDGDLAARIGGDEFIVVLKNIPSQDVAVRRGFDFCTSLSSASTDFPITCSGGVTTFIGKPDIKQVIEEADQALYHAKRGGKNHCCLWKPQNFSLLTAKQ